MDLDTRLSEHFTLREMIFSDNAIRNKIDNYPENEIIIENLKRLCVLLEQVRSIVSKAIHINSGYRNHEVNRLAQSSDKSQHRKGCAADIVITGMTPHEVCNAVIASGIEFDQMIREWDSWTHISVPTLPESKPRFSKLIIDAESPLGRPFI